MPAGGNQPPARPAAVSVPGSGRRTDGGPGSKKQPIRVPSGGAYGERQAAEQQQAGAPMAGGGPAMPGAAGPSPQGGPPQGGGAFGPTQRPNEPNTQMPGVQQQNPLATNPQAALRVLYARFPNPAIKRLMDWSAYGSKPPK